MQGGCPPPPTPPNFGRSVNTNPTKNGLIIPFMIEASLDSTFITLFCFEKNFYVFFFKCSKKKLKRKALLRPRPDGPINPNIGRVQE